MGFLAGVDLELSVCLEEELEEEEEEPEGWDPELEEGLEEEKGRPELELERLKSELEPEVVLLVLSVFRVSVLFFLSLFSCSSTLQ